MDAKEDRAVIRALSSPLRMRILRYCLHEAHTNGEIAAEFGLNPGTSLHHVRTLVETGFLAAQDARIGARGSREIPYLATRRSWNTYVPDIGPILVRTFLDEIEGLDPDQLRVVRLGLKLDAAAEEELMERLIAVLVEFKDRPPVEGGRPISIMLAEHPDQRRTG